MFKHIKKILLLYKAMGKNDSIIVVAQRMQCRVTHKRKDC